MPGGSRAWIYQGITATSLHHRCLQFGAHGQAKGLPYWGAELLNPCCTHKSLTGDENLRSGPFAAALQHFPAPCLAHQVQAGDYIEAPHNCMHVLRASLQHS